MRCARATKGRGAKKWGAESVEFWLEGLPGLVPPTHRLPDWKATAAALIYYYRVQFYYSNAPLDTTTAKLGASFSHRLSPLIWEFMSNQHPSDGVRRLETWKVVLLHRWEIY